MKIVPSEERAEYFLDGRLYCNTLRYFSEHEDKQEGAIALPPHDLRVSLNLRSFVISKENIVSATLHPDIVADLNVFCMYSWAAPKVGEDHVLFDKEPQLGSIRELVKGYGEHVVVMRNVTEFFDRVKRAADCQDSGVILAKGGLIRYTEARKRPRDISEALRVALHKQEDFAKEQEYRFVFHTDRKPGPFVLSIGDLRDIAGRIRTEDHYDSVKVGVAPLSWTH